MIIFNKENNQAYYKKFQFFVPVTNSPTVDNWALRHNIQLLRYNTLHHNIPMVGLTGASLLDQKDVLQGNLPESVNTDLKIIIRSIVDASNHVPKYGKYPLSYYNKFPMAELTLEDWEKRLYFRTGWILKFGNKYFAQDLRFELADKNNLLKNIKKIEL